MTLGSSKVKNSCGRGKWVMGEKMYVLGGQSWTVTESGTADCSCKRLRLGAAVLLTGYGILCFIRLF